MKTRTIELNDAIEFTFIVADGSRQLYQNKIEEIGFSYERKNIDHRVCQFTITGVFTEIMIGQLADLFCSK